jgi:hypothetical protein
MPLTRSPQASLLSKTRLGRPASPHCRGGASSVLRLAQPVAPRLPQPVALSGWMQRAAGALAR